MGGPQKVKFNNETERVGLYLFLITRIFGHGGEKTNSFTITTEFPVFQEVSSHPLCNNYTVACLVILRTWQARPTPSSHSHVCSFYRLEIYKPNHDLRELNILLGKPPHPQSGILGCQLHRDCMCSFLCVHPCVCKREQE